MNECFYVCRCPNCGFPISMPTSEIAEVPNDYLQCSRCFYILKVSSISDDFHTLSNFTFSTDELEYCRGIIPDYDIINKMYNPQNFTVMNLIPIFNALKGKLNVSCQVDERNPNIVKISWSNTSKDDNIVWESYDRITVKEETRSVFFDANCKLKIDFDKILHLWDNETDEKYSNIRKPFKSEDGTKRAIAASFPRHLDRVIPIIESKDYEQMKEFFYDCRGAIGFDIVGL